jgi:hypothetical protein
LFPLRTNCFSLWTCCFGWLYSKMNWHARNSLESCKTWFVALQNQVFSRTMFRPSMHCFRFLGLIVVFIVVLESPQVLYPTLRTYVPICCTGLWNFSVPSIPCEPPLSKCGSESVESALLRSSNDLGKIFFRVCETPSTD